VNTSVRRRLLLTCYPADAGVARHVVDLASVLDPQAWQIDVACLPGSLPERELRDLPNVRLHLLAGRQGRPQPRDALDLPLLARLVAEADVAHAHSSKAGFATRLAARLRGYSQKTLFTPHAWSFWVGGRAESRAYLALERLAARWCRAIVAVSEGERAAGIAADVGRPGQYRVITNGIDLAPYAAESDPRPGRIVMVGRLARQKRPDVAVRALAAVRAARPEATLDLVGDGPLRREVEGLAAQTGVEDGLRLLGLREDVPELLSRASCFLLTSDYEGCPLSVLEAMAAGAPVVATAVGGVPELVVEGETGILVEPGRPDLVAGALSELLADPLRARLMGLAGRMRARALFSRERMVREIETLYREVADGG
jgi:glycosyltransferase involved in cell wall biosynthesis